MRTRRTRRKVNPRFYILVTVLLAMIVLAVLVLKPGGKSGSLSPGSQALTMQATAILIRSETCHSVEKYDRVSYQVQEGAQVTAEMPVAVVYRWGYTDDMTQALLNVQAQIYAKQMELLGGVESAELTALNAQITAKQREIREALSESTRTLTVSAVSATATPQGGDASASPSPSAAPQAAEAPLDLLTIENDIKALLTQRSNLLKQYVQADEALNALYSEAETKKAQLAEYTSEVAAKGGGVASFYFDGYEQVLNADKLDVISAELVNKVLSNAGAGGTGTENLLYRLVEPNKWYMAFVTPRDQALRVCAGQVYAVRAEGYADKLFMGTALEPVVNENGVVNLLEFSEDIGALISVRSVKITLTADTSGMKVPLSAIIFDKGVPMLTVAGAKTPLNVLSADEDTAIVTAKEGGAFQAGQRYGK
ncbi:MAG: HlyD family efflux transporter periplasmic adaptor subunit [Candidatus Pelethousia sp.]|nr:HlyD family efflux transporter periplasmic adaptor subunit [Candidatus Pelethousia sp.]